MQDLILEPFAGIVFGMTPGAVDAAVRPAERRRAARHDAGRRCSAPGAAGRRRRRCAAGASAAASPRRWRCSRWLFGALEPQDWPLRANVFALGVANGAFAVAAIGSMMALAGAGPQRPRRRAHGPVGRGAGHRVRARRRAGHGRSRRGQAGRGGRRPRLRRWCSRLEACVFLWAALLASRRDAVVGTAPGRARAAVVPAHLPYAREAAE